MKLFIVFLISVLPAMSFGLRCYECLNCTKENPPKQEHELECKNGPKEQRFCVKGDTPNVGEYVFACENISPASFGVGCITTASKGLRTANTICYCKTDLCNTPDYDVTYSVPHSCGGETKLYSLVGFTFAGALLSTVLHKISM